MGPGLKRRFLGFSRLADLNGLHRSKIRTNAVENRLSQKGSRTVNIDPGYIDAAKLVLFSTKDYTHRIHTSNGIFAEVTLFYKDRTYNPWPWTYPDYASREYIRIFNQIREGYLKKRQQQYDI